MTAERSDDLPARVRAIRKQRGLTQQQFAEAAGVGYRSYQNFENGVHRPQPANMRLILDYAALEQAETLTLTDFLGARFRDTIADAREVQALAVTRGLDPHDTREPALRLARRAIADVEAKRRIVELHWSLLDDEGDGPPVERCDCVQPTPCPTLRALALPYVDHPDYRQEWKP